MLDAKPTLVSIFLKFANEVDADHLDDASVEPFLIGAISAEIGRASCRERV